jgi:hypothetical protein
MKSRDEQIKEKIESYINQLRYKLPEKDINYLIEQSPKLFTLKTIDDESIMFSFFEYLTEYYKNSVSSMYKILTKKTTTNKRDKKENAIKGANAIIDYLGGIFSNNENSKELKLMLRDFIGNPEKYKNKTITHTITKDDLRSELRKIIPNKSTEIDEFIKGLKNFQI